MFSQREMFALKFCCLLIDSRAVSIVEAVKARLRGVITSCLAELGVADINAVFRPLGPGGGGERFAQAIFLDVQASRLKAAAIV